MLQICDFMEYYGKMINEERKTFARQKVVKISF